MLRVKGRVLVGPDEVRDELWAVGGRITYERPPGADRAVTVRGGRCPDWSTRTAMWAWTGTARSTRRPPRSRRSPTGRPERC